MLLLMEKYPGPLFRPPELVQPNPDRNPVAKNSSEFNETNHVRRTELNLGSRNSIRLNKKIKFQQTDSSEYEIDTRSHFIQMFEKPLLVNIDRLVNH